MKIHRIEVDFAVPVEVTSREQQQIAEIIEGICRRSEREDPELEGHCHWQSGCGSKLLFSARDAAFLGTEAAPPDRRPADGEEPDVDSEVLAFTTASRELYPQEKAEREGRAAHDASGCTEGSDATRWPPVPGRGGPNPYPEGTELAEAWDLGFVRQCRRKQREAKERESLPPLTAAERRTVEVARIAASDETDALLEIIDRLAGKA